MLTEDDLNGIKVRHKIAQKGIKLTDSLLEDIPKLVSELERLRDENSRLCPIGDLDIITSLQTDKAYLNDIIKEKDAEIERLNRKLSLIRERALEPVDAEVDQVSVALLYEIYLHAKEVR